MTTIYKNHEDENEDGITEVLKVYSDDYNEPLIGDYRGIELIRIYYIPSRSDSVNRAEDIAMELIHEECKTGSIFDPNKGMKFYNRFCTITL